MAHTNAFAWIFAPSEWGGACRGASLGPDAIAFEDWGQASPLFGQQPILRLGRQPAPAAANQPAAAKHLQSVTQALDEVATAVAQVRQQGQRALVLSGDHSNAAGTLAGLRRAHPQARLGVIWIDAHGDLHTPWTSPSGNIHGMPLGAALGYAKPPQQGAQFATQTVDAETAAQWQQLLNLAPSPWVTAPDLVFVGLRDYEAYEAWLLEHLGLPHYPPTTVAKRGLEAVADEALNHLSHCDALYVTFDVDSLDGRLVPGTGTPVPDGLGLMEAEALLRRLWADPRLMALELTEVNPLLDRANQTARLAHQLLSRVLAP